MAYTPEEREKLFETIFELIENGKSLRKALATVKLSSSTFFIWIDENENKSKQYARACEERAEALLDEMIDIAKSLSKNIPCLRVDLYLCNDKIYIGELTFSHFAGFTKFEPKEYETILGNYIKIGGKRNEKK